MIANTVRAGMFELDAGQLRARCCPVEVEQVGDHQVNDSDCHKDDEEAFNEVCPCGYVLVELLITAAGGNS